MPDCSRRLPLHTAHRRHIPYQVVYFKQLDATGWPFIGPIQPELRSHRGK